MTLGAAVGVAVIYLIGWALVAWIAWDTDRNLKRKYSQATDEDVDQFMRDNSGLMDDLAGRKKD